MDVPVDSPFGAGGVAIFQIHFALENVIGGPSAPFLLDYEQILQSGSTSAQSHWDTNGLIGLNTLSGGPITVANGSVWDVSFTIRAAVQALPGMLPASNPKGALSEASFLNTVYWGGLHDIVDGQGNPLPNFGMQSELGFDWVSSVPEPSQAVLLLAGAALIGLRRRCGRLGAGRDPCPAGAIPPARDPGPTARPRSETRTAHLSRIRPGAGFPPPARFARCPAPAGTPRPAPRPRPRTGPAGCGRPGPPA